MVNHLDIFGDKWSLVVVRDIFNGKKSFGEFMTSPEKISTSVLTNRLYLLEHEGVIQHILSSIDKKVKLYYLTDRGIDLFPVLYEMVHWSKRNLNKKFHPFANTHYQSITKNQKNYKEKREELLELH